MQDGGDEYVYSPDWLDQYWTVDEFLLIRLCVEDRLADLYVEAEDALAACCRRRPPGSTRGARSPTRFG